MTIRSSVQRRCTWLTLAVAATLGQFATAPIARAATDDALMTRAYAELSEMDGVPVVTPTGADRTTASRCIREGVIPAEDKAAFDNYLRFKIAEFTKPGLREVLPRKRDEIKKQALIQSGRAQNKETHDYLNKVLLAWLPRIALDEQYHPVTRYNAMMLLGYLDDVEMDLTGEGAVPLPAGRAVLLDSTLKTDQPEWLRMAAMYGLWRHCEYSNGTVGPNVVDALATIAGADKPGQGISAEGHKWMRRRATRSLGALAQKNSPEIKAEAVTALVNVLSDHDLSLMTRADAALAIGGLNKAKLDAAKVDSKKLMVSLAEVAIDLGKFAKDDKSKITPEWATYILLSVRSGVQGTQAGQGVAAVATGDVKNLVSELTGQLDSAVKFTGGTHAEEFSVRQQLQIRGDELQRWVTKAGAPAAPPAGATPATGATTPPPAGAVSLVP